MGQARTRRRLAGEKGIYLPDRVTSLLAIEARPEYTGLPHKLVKQLTPSDINWRAKTVSVCSRRKGQGARARILPVTAAGMAALRRFAELECWGPFSHASMTKSFQRACHAAGRDGNRCIRAGWTEAPIP